MRDRRGRRILHQMWDTDAWRSVFSRTSLGDISSLPCSSRPAQNSCDLRGPEPNGTGLAGSLRGVRLLAPIAIWPSKTAQVEPSGVFHKSQATCERRLRQRRGFAACR